MQLASDAYLFNELLRVSFLITYCMYIVCRGSSCCDRSRWFGTHGSTDGNAATGTTGHSDT